ncbi:hypothetical protein [Nocardioides sp. YIM 152315]|uniref:hypothetical protein n=1 Tax=Nocardioides sp. YIM 152315 TaxID=3031760 RepID=UPI0023D9B5E0|nr:hypothetical protein [Nocardioides sp. YIM 152315]MDF1603862.1 hypothetical protein [Nocardioides sp. YIM 152315]
MREGEVADPYAEDPEPDDPDAPPYWFPGQHLPPDARAMGLTHHVPEGAILDFAAGSTPPSRPTGSRRGVCW